MMGQWISTLTGQMQWENDQGYTTGTNDSGQTYEQSTGSGNPSNPNNIQLPNLGDPGAQNGQGAFTSSSGGSGTFGSGSSDPSGGNSGQGSGLMDAAPPGGQQYAANYGSGGAGGGQIAGEYAPGGGGGGQIGMTGNSSAYDPNAGGFYRGNSVGNLADQTNAQNANRYGSSSNALGSTVRGPSNTGQIGGGFSPGSPSDMIANATPWNGGPQSMLGQTGFKTGENQTPNPYMTMSGFHQGGIGGPQTQAYNQYQGMLANPTSMTANPAYKAIMDASLQAAQRSSLAHGGNGGGTMAAELAQTGAAVAGQYLPQMANMYQQGAQQEIGNWATQNQGNQNAGFLGSNLYGTANQANLGYGNLGNNMYQNAANNQFNRGIAYSNAQINGANTASAQLAMAQNQPSNQYFQNQLTMQGFTPPP